MMPLMQNDYQDVTPIYILIYNCNVGYYIKNRSILGKDCVT